jgi:hypothetical protein
MRYFFLLFFLGAIGVVTVCGFRGSKSSRPPIEIFPDMVRQNKVRPETPNDFFPDQMASRMRPEGTVARSKPYEVGGTVVKVDGKEIYPYENSPVNTGKITGTTNWVELDPLPITRQFLERGQQRFQIYCAPCHGADGDGKGITSRYGMLPANFHDERIVKMSAGEIFNTITYGKNTMGPYGPNVPVEDRWAIIAWVRVLQRSQLATIEDVPEPERAKFK